MDEKHLKIYAELLANAHISEAMIKANPLPYLERAAQRIRKLETAMKAASMTLAGMDNFDIATELAPDSPPSIVETAVARNDKAKAYIDRGLSFLPNDL